MSVRIPARTKTLSSEPIAVDPRTKVAAVYDAITALQANPQTLGFFTRSGQAELNRVAHRCDGVLNVMDREDEIA